MDLLTELLSSKTRSKIFTILFNEDVADLHLREIERKAGLTVTTLSKELKKLTDLDIIISRRDGNRLYYRANIDHPLYEDIKSLVSKTTGLIFQLRKKLENQNITLAFVFGSIAKNEEMAHSDVDLFIVGNIGMRSVSKLLSGVQKEIGREINPHIFTIDEFKNRVDKKEHFVMQVLKSKKRFILGNSNELKRLCGQRLA